MDRATLILSNLIHRPRRAILNVVALSTAFLLFGLLQALTHAFESDVSAAGAERLIVDSRYSLTENLPLSMVEQIRRVDGVEAVTHMSWFGGIVGDPKDVFPQYVVDPRSYFAVYPDLEIDPMVLETFATNRRAIVAAEPLAIRLGWSIGDTIPIECRLWPRRDGETFWKFELVGTFRNPNPAAGDLLLLPYDTFNDAVIDSIRGQVGWLAVRVSNSDHARTLASSIDERFENSSTATRTATEDEYRLQFARQLGDVGLVATSVLFAVFFTALLVTGTAMSQAFRERTPQLATLKAVGFSDQNVAFVIVAEAVVLCIVGAGLGLVFAALLIPFVNSVLEAWIGSVAVGIGVVGSGFFLAFALAIVISIRPAWAAARLPITSGLRGN